MSKLDKKIGYYFEMKGLDVDAEHLIEAARESLGLGEKVRRVDCLDYYLEEGWFQLDEFLEWLIN